ncbi:hypothetical protein MKX01_025786 [Papaver californicum]|nr:hypothetical protein MKX01_025786 [Papaver californicum]
MGLSNLFLLLPVTGLLITATLLVFIFWHMLWKLMNGTKDSEGKQYEEKLLPQDIGNKMKPSKWQVDGIPEDLTLIVYEINSLHQVVSSLENTVQSWVSIEDIRPAVIIRSMDYIYANSENTFKGRKALQVDGIHEDLTLILDEIDSLHQLVSSLENTVQSLGSRDDTRLAAIIHSMDYIYANSEKMFKGSKALQDLPSNGSLDHILKSNEYLQGYQHVVDILEPACDFNLTTNGLSEDELLENFKQGMMQMINQVEYLMVELDELINLPQHNLTKVITGDHEVLILMRRKLANLHKEFLSVEKSIESLYCKKDISFAGVKFLFNFLGEAIRWLRLRTLDSSI